MGRYSDSQSIILLVMVSTLAVIIRVWKRANNALHDQVPRSEARKQNESWSNQRPQKSDDREPLPPNYNLKFRLMIWLACTWKIKNTWNSCDIKTSGVEQNCEFHRCKGHGTVDCRALKQEIVELLKKGHLLDHYNIAFIVLFISFNHKFSVIFSKQNKSLLVVVIRYY